MLAPTLWVRQMDWLGDSKHLFICGNMVVDALENQIVYRYKDSAVGAFYFLGGVNESDLLLWNRKKGDVLEVITPKPDK
jgi:hypothetical protein